MQKKISEHNEKKLLEKTSLWLPRNLKKRNNFTQLWVLYSMMSSYVLEKNNGCAELIVTFGGRSVSSSLSSPKIRSIINKLSHYKYHHA